MPIDIGGDTSVKWNATVDSVRDGMVKWDDDQSIPTTGKHYLVGVEDTPDGDQDFTISIEIPQDARRPNAKSSFAAALRAAASAADAAQPNSTVRVSFPLPIEDNKKGAPNEHQ